MRREKERKKERFNLPLISKREISKIVVRSFVLTAIAYLFLAPLTTNLQATKEVYRSFNEGVNDCSFSQQYDAIATFGAGNNENADGTQSPNSFSRGRLDTTAILIEEGYSDKVILLDGYQGKEADPDTNKNYLLNQASNLNKDDVFVDPSSTSTATNVDSAEQIMEKEGFDNVAFVTDRFHKRRAGTILKIKEVNGCIFTVEAVNQKYHPERMKEIRKRNRGEGSIWRGITEILKTISLLYDSQGNLTASLERTAANVFNK